MFLILILFALALSVAVEHSFSCGRILISHLRNRLRANTICALMCFGDWCRQTFVGIPELSHWLAQPKAAEEEDFDANELPDLVDDESLV